VEKAQEGLEKNWSGLRAIVKLGITVEVGKKEPELGCANPLIESGRKEICYCKKEPKEGNERKEASVDRFEDSHASGRCRETREDLQTRGMQ